jgi:hypothetical protein
MSLYGGPRDSRKNSEAAARVLAARLRRLVDVSLEVAWPDANPGAAARLRRCVTELSVTYMSLDHLIPFTDGNYTMDSSGPLPLRFQCPEAFYAYATALEAMRAALGRLGPPAVSDSFVSAFYNQHVETMLAITSPKAQGKTPCPTRISIQTSTPETPTPPATKSVLN